VSVIQPFVSESTNARKGIKTELHGVGVSIRLFMSESTNARKGIKTHECEPNHKAPDGQNQQMPVRALRHNPFPAGKFVFMCQNQQMPVRALRLKCSL